MMMVRKQHLVVTAIAMAALSLAAFAADSATEKRGGSRNPEFEAAIQACSNSVAKDSRGGPDRTAMDSCMSAKGFTRPAGPPPGEHGQPPADGERPQ